MSTIRKFVIVGVSGLLLTVGVSALADNVIVTAQPSVETDQLIVTYHDGATTDEILSAEKSVNARNQKAAKSLGKDTRVFKVDNPLAAKNIISKNKAVKSVELDIIRDPSLTPNDQYFSYTEPFAYAGQIDRKYTSAEAAWDRSTGDATVRIAIVDSGIAPHPDLVPNLTSGYDVSGGSPTVDATAHGTQVAGMAAARGNDGYGVAGYCWNCRLMPVKVTRGTSGTAYDSDLASGIRWAADNGARIINVSYGGPTGSTTLASAVQYAQSRGSLVVAAAGNSGTNVPNYPASYEGVIGVGEALSSSRLELQLSSSFGSTVDIAAPTALTTSTKDANGAWRIQLVGGTSLASPAVAGTLGLMLATVPTASNASLLAALCGGATPMSTAKPIACGRLDAAASINLLAGGGPTTPPTPTATPTPPPTLAPTPTQTPVVDSIAPSKPVLTASVKRSNVVLKWTVSTDNVGVKNYSVYRNGVLAYTLPVGTTGVTDKPGPGAASYTVVSSDAAGNRTTSNLVTVQVK